jgi:hypothetical protein
MVDAASTTVGGAFPMGEMASATVDVTFPRRKVALATGFLNKTDAGAWAAGRDGSGALRDVLPAAGGKFQFDAATIKPLIQLANSEMKKIFAASSYPAHFFL